MIAILAELSSHVMPWPGPLAVGPNYTVAIILGVAVIAAAAVASALVLKK